MALIPGAHLGPYEITAQIGVGGMGEVYRATDTKLKRQVAIKVLPASVAGDAERLARFQREAEVLASLNHPNIAAIYGLEDAAGVKALVMELVEGPTLADRIALGAIPIDEALPIAKQIAEALEAAHEQGIIHRDLKPANIKVRADGTVKVLDFGLAKAMEPAAGSSPSMSMLPTITTPAMTQAGMILGTAAYMSPEQARGKPVDTRTDVWAFGCVLYEMLTGQRAFEAEDVSLTLAEVMKSEPEWRAVPALPPFVESFLRQCLRKNPRQRTQAIGDIRLALEGEFQIVSRAATAHAAPEVQRPVWQRAIPLTITALIAALIAGSAGRMMAPTDAGGVIRLTHTLPNGRGFRNTGRRGVAISPDGRHIVYNGTGGLYLRDMDTLDERSISGTEEGLASPVFSPDGQSLTYYQGGQLRRIGIAGGPRWPSRRQTIRLVSAGGRTGRFCMLGAMQSGACQTTAASPNG